MLYKHAFLMQYLLGFLWNVCLPLHIAQLYLFVIEVYLTQTFVCHSAQGSLKSVQVLLESGRVDIARQSRTKQTTLILATTQVQEVVTINFGHL